MTFDVFSFFIGIASTIAISTIYYGIAVTIERNHQWNEVLYNSPNPSELHWLKSLQETPPSIGEKESAVSKVTYPQHSQS